jgi:hypothetical protein
VNDYDATHVTRTPIQKLHSLVTTNLSTWIECCAAAKVGREAKWLETLFSSVALGDLHMHFIILFSDESKGFQGSS